MLFCTLSLQIIVVGAEQPPYDDQVTNTINNNNNNEMIEKKGKSLNQLQECIPSYFSINKKNT